MILLLLAAQIVIDDTDRASFAGYRRRVLAQAQAADPGATASALLPGARKYCHRLIMAAESLEMAAAKIEAEAGVKDRSFSARRHRFPAGKKLAALQQDLTVEAEALVEQKKRAQVTDAQH